MMGPALIIFVRNPVAGKVKTRLAAKIGSEQAVLIYKKLLEYTRTVTGDIPEDKFVFYDEFINGDDIWDNSIYKKALQCGPDLGERMKNAFEFVFKRGHRNVLIIGSDCREISPEEIRQGFEALHKTDFVIGPAKDGGYYLLGMSYFFPQIFDEKRWSSSTVYSDTITHITKFRKSYHVLKMLSDVD